MITLNEAQKIVANAQKVVVLTGADISTESGVPDFRSEVKYCGGHPQGYCETRENNLIGRLF